MATVPDHPMPRLTYRRFPSPARAHPGVADALELARWRREATQRGQTICRDLHGPPGRSGTLAACLLISAGTAREAAIAAVRAARGPRALKTIAQEDSAVMCAVAISGARWPSPSWRARAPNRAGPASHRLDVSCQVQGHPP
jgi:hypothetical protein